jgi:hypothetical protein
VPHWRPGQQPRGCRLPYGRRVLAFLNWLLEHHFGMNSPYSLIFWRFDDLLKALVFGKAAKSHRSILSWRERRDGLPKTSADLARAASQKTYGSPAWSGASSIFNEKAHDRQSSIDEYPSASPARSVGYGYGRQGEKQAANNGYITNKPVPARSGSGGSPGSKPYVLRMI